MSAQFKLICQLVISVIVILGFFVFVFALFFLAKAIDPSAKESLTLITGSLISAFAGICGFWLGTSLSSAAKDATISTLSNQGTAR